MMTDGGEAEEENREREVEQKHNNNKYSSGIVFVVDIVKIEYENNKQTIYSNNTHVDD